MTTAAPSTAAGVLAVAADLIEEHGKADGVLQGADGCLCAIGALRLAAFGTITFDAPDSELYIRARMALAAQIELLAPGRYRAGRVGTPISVVLWSDASTKAEVVAGLRAAAELAGTGVAA
jgi:hypothetical protein